MASPCIPLILTPFPGDGLWCAQAEPQERLTTLDGQERNLTPDMLIIADGEKGVAIAGIMGGLDTEIQSTTKNILLESAYFEPRCIRRTAKKLGLSSEASIRFERGVDIEGVIKAADRASLLIQELAGGEIVPGWIDAYPQPLIISTDPSGYPKEQPVLRDRSVIRTGCRYQPPIGPDRGQ